MQDCPIDSDLDAYKAEELSLSEQEEVALHLDECQDCRDYLSARSPEDGSVYAAGGGISIKKWTPRNLGGDID